MSEILILIRAQVAADHYDDVERGAVEIRDRLVRVAGFRAYSVWESTFDEGAIFAVIEYADEDAAKRGLEVWSEFVPTMRHRIPFQTPADATSVSVVRRVGPNLEESGLDAFMSFSSRVAPTGQEGELLADVDMVFEGLALMPGFRAAIYGENATLKEQVVMLATWDGKAAFDASLPPRMPHYDVLLFRRVA